MTQQNLIQIFSHWDQGTWSSNYEHNNLWPSIQRKVWHTSQFIDKLRAIFDHNHSDYVIDIKDSSQAGSGYYLVFYGCSASILEHHGLACMTPDIVDRCNQGQLKLLIAFVHETFDSQVSVREWFAGFCNKLTEMGLTRSHSVLILTSTQSQVKLDFDHRCEFAWYPWFEADLQASFKLINKSPLSIDFENKRKHYINLNFAARTHRFLMVMYLIYRGVRDQGHVSWRNPQLQTWRELLGSRGLDHLDFSWKKQIDNFANGSMDFFNFLNAVNVLESMELDHVDPADVGTHNGVTWVGADKYYHESYVDLVSETHCELYGDVFLTEKSFKPMAHGLPFVLNASRSSLSQIRGLGYETWPELFDESYDHMPASMDKIAAVGDQIVAFCHEPERVNRVKTDPEVRAKLEHNQRVFWEKNHAQQLGQLLHLFWNRGHA